MNRYAYEFDINSNSIAARVIRLVGYDKRVLELGCSSGHMSAILQAHGCQVVGVDFDAVAVETARQYCSAVYAINLENADWPQEMSGEAAFDVIVAADVLEHLRDPGRCFEYFRQLLKPDGILIISTPNIAYGGVIASLLQGTFHYAETGLLDKTHVHFFTEQSLRELLLAKAYSVVHFDSVNADIDHPEFSKYWDALDADLRKKIQERPNAMAFQFILTAFPSETRQLDTSLAEIYRQYELKNNVAQKKFEAEILNLKTMLLEKKHECEKHVAGKLQLTEQQNRLEEELARIEQESRKTNLVLQTILTSTTWQISAPLRYVARAVPLSLRQAIGRFLKRSIFLTELIFLGPTKGWPYLANLLKRKFLAKNKIFTKFCSKVAALTLPTVATPPEAARSLDIDYSLAIPFKFELPVLADNTVVAAVIHLFYEDLAVECRTYLSKIPCNVDIYISTTDAFKAGIIQQVFKSWTKGTVDVRIVPNRGRDIAPKLISFADVYHKYEYVLCLHGKRSHHANVLAPWRHFIFESLLGNEEIVKSILFAFETNPKLGMISSQHFEPMRHWTNWGGNFAKASALATRMGFGIDEKAALDFPSGSMFWARTAALKPLLDLHLSIEKFDPELGQTDATLAHALERVFFHSCEYAGYQWMKVACSEFFANTPAIIEVADADAFLHYQAEYGFELLKPNGVKPRALPVPAVANAASSLFERVRDSALGTAIVLDPAVKIAIGLVSYNNSREELRLAIESAKISLQTAGYEVNAKLFVLDNGADTTEYIEQSDLIERQAPKGNVGFGAGHNHLMKIAFARQFDVYIAINPDGALHPDAISEMMKTMMAANGRAIVEALQFPSEHPKPYDPHTLDTPWVSGACLAVPRAAFEATAGFDETFFMYCEDVDFSWRAKAHGFALKTNPRALFFHSVTNRKMTPATLEMILRSGYILAKKWNAFEFEQEMKLTLVERNFVVPSVAVETVPKEWSQYADFTHQFSFSNPRW
ncbi:MULTISPECIES: rhamnan synthesis F family protein [unclassified Undibacterium]|uniref:rhamnan synthesis F family protein n=1 Tax=unclassified Undibacterium TaxID=2630295 RepID=UPI002AC9BE45|nr:MULTISPECIES: rhamnan synthesis F family protein [unclassified Undibacterium]MEB0139928.1 rhamnan synthesis F family protein [Undibacterium sp. CCC2.1]MEB0172901.1 rhamnan synthesis F family protein [Undibacterium sp. CCC1.1]MEB0176728.1 rhamnan synthesis F family protein [Undibacterium sp. CCC3.4]MEB0216655.1 rhamnan synthesis F family protein [Undibacterium sp. 5I2]WPX44967.1 rhamnan synthesis F family protein [Undibacterium sp. CCC3.4]